MTRIRPKPIPHHQEGHVFVNPTLPLPPALKRRVPAHRTYNYIETIVQTDKVKIPDVVVILGSGPNGRAAWPLIPKDAYVIALNEGVNACIDHPKECNFVPAMWVVNDHHATETVYWAKASNNFHGIRCFGDRTIEVVRTKFLYTPGQMDAMRDGILFSIPRGPFHKSEQGNWFHDPLLFKPGGTVASAAIWLAYIKGPPKRIYLCGIDMSRDVHYSNLNEPAQPDPRHGLEWNTSRPALDERIRYYKTLGVEFFTLSDTKLQNVEKVDKVE